MSLATATITYDISDLVGTDFDARRTKIWVTTNIDGGAIIDTDGNQVRIGDGLGTIADDGTGSVVVWVPGAGSNPASWQTYVHVDHSTRRPAAAGGGRDVRTFGPFTVTGNANLADLVAEQEVSPTYLSAVTTELQTYVDAAEAAAADAAEAAVAGKGFSLEPAGGDEYQVTGDDISSLTLLPGRSGPSFTARSSKLMVTVSCVALAPGGVLLGAAITPGGGVVPDGASHYSYAKTSVATTVTTMVLLDCEVGDVVEVIPVMSSPFAESFINVGDPSLLAGYGPVSILVQQIAA